MKEKLIKSLYYYYWFLRTIHFRRHFFKLKVLTIDDTIKDIINYKKSISRFGDGEFRLILPNENLKFQDESKQLTERLKEVLTSNLENHIVAVPESFHSVKAFKLNVKYWWIDFINKFGNQLSPYFRKEKTYGNAFISRFYLDYENKLSVEENISNLKKLWENKEVLIIEGEFSRLGVGNDLFNNVKSLKRILCPSKNAFSNYHEIYNKAKEHGENQLILIALGPTASVLAYDLAKENFWALDVGHVDIEYMWFLENATFKKPVKYRLVNESNEQLDIDIPELEKLKYEKSIIEIIY